MTVDPRLRGTRYPLLGVVTVLAACAVLALAVVAVLRTPAAEFTTGRVPIQFYRSLETRALLDDYAGVFAIAHNSGDSLPATREAIEHGADVIEIDVARIGQVLYAAHRRPLPVVGVRMFRGPRLAEVWDTAATVEVIKLDLKESSPTFVELVLGFIEQRERRETIVVSPYAHVLAAFEERVPHVVRILSVPNGHRLDRVLRSDDVLDRIDGMSVTHIALRADHMQALRARRLLVFAYTVNDLGRLNELVLQGVDGVTTDNLAIMEILGGPRLEETSLRDRIPTVDLAANP